MSAIHQLLTDHIDIWTAADIEKKSGRGRSSGNAASVYGIRKLRELILELAVRGKLVPQDPNDEPASELLKRIQAEKAKLIAEGKIKKGKPLTPITDDEKPFDLPQGWGWTRVAHVGHDWGQKTPDSDFTYIEVSAIDSKSGVVSSPELVKPEDAPSRARKIVKKDTVIYSTVRPYLLNIAVIEQDFSPDPVASTAFAIVHPFCSMPSRYFLCFFRSPVFVRYVESVQMGIAYPAINDAQFFSGLIPLPPVAEQHRIVAKVDELMALCDQLETQHSNAAEAHEKLVSHLLGTLTQSPNTDSPLCKRGAGGDLDWQRIAAHFDTLFTTEASIDALKQTLLQLAVMGKLVPQDPNDEPASELLKRIRAEKAKLIAEGKIKKSKSLPPITNEEKPFELPLGWEWARVEQLFEVTSGGSFDISSEKDSGEYIYVKVGDMNVSENETVITTSSRFVNPSEKELRGIIPANSIIFPKRGGAIATNKKRLVTSEIFVDLNIMAITVPKSVSLIYTFQWLRGIDLAQLNTGTSVPQINHKDIEPLIFPLPPLAEQHRIVAKVDELMAICDQLKARIAEANQLQQKLADALVEQALS